MSNDVVEFQRLASGYVPGKSETFAAGTSPVSAVLQNCTVFRTPGVPSGMFDVLVGLPESTTLGETSLRSPDMPAPIGIGGAQVNDPPLNVAGGGIIVSQGRVTATIRSTLTNPATSVNPNVTWAVQYGASLGPVPIYPGFSNAQLVRFIFTGADAPANADFDFSIERVIDPNVEP